MPKLIERIEMLEKVIASHLQESGEIRSDLRWLKWINMGIAALVCFKLVADFLVRR